MPAPSHRWVWPLLLTLTGSVVFANSLSGVFTFDDIVGLVENESIRQLWPPTAVLSPPADSEPVAGRPLVNVSFAINYALDGLEVRGYHAVNIALHIGCALLLFGLVRRTLLLPGSGTPWLTPPFRAEYVAAAAALLWMVHPLTTEAVNYVSQRTELMMALFLLATLYAGVRAAVDRGRWPLVAVATCALGMACKETMVVAPVLVVLYDRVFLYRSWAEAARARGSFYPALAATWILLAALIWSGPRWETAGFSTGVSPWTYLLNQSVILVEYLKRVIWPVNLVHDYGEPLARSLSGVAPYAATIVALLAATAYALMRHPAVGFLGATFFLVLAPTSSILPIATEVGAERRMYLPLAALSVLLVLAATDVWRRIPRLALPGALATMLLLAVPLSAATIVRNRDYADELTLWQTTLERWPHARAHRNYATLLKREGRREQVIEHLRLALDGTHPEGRYALGVELLEQGRTAEAIGELRRFLEEVPHDPMAVPAREFLAAALLKERRFAEAAAEYARITQARPTFARAWSNLGLALTQAGGGMRAIEAFRRAVALDLRDPVTRRSLAAALIEMDLAGEALAHARAAVQLDPADAYGRLILGVALAGNGHGAAAAQEFRRALERDPSMTEARDLLAMIEQQPRPRPGHE